MVRPPLRISLLDVATILYHVHRGSQLDELVGFEDCERTLDQLTSELSRKTRVRVSKEALEAALWSCNLMHEVGMWWSPQGETFPDFLKRVTERSGSALEFNPIYNQLKFVDSDDAERHTNCKDGSQD